MGFQNIEAEDEDENEDNSHESEPSEPDEHTEESYEGEIGKINHNSHENLHNYRSEEKKQEDAKENSNSLAPSKDLSSVIELNNIKLGQSYSSQNEDKSDEHQDNDDKPGFLNYGEDDSEEDEERNKLIDDDFNQSSIPFEPEESYDLASASCIDAIKDKMAHEQILEKKLESEDSDDSNDDELFKS